MSANETMQAIRYHDYGGPEQLVLERVPRPQAQAETVLVRVHAAGVNPVDWKVRSGASKGWTTLQFPYIPGFDLAGVVEQLGPGAAGFRAGEAVFGTAPSGAYAEYVVAPAITLAPKPRNLTFDQAAAVPIGAMTAWKALFDVAGLQAGQRILVQGAAGGVGSFAVQLARWKGAHVVGTASAVNHDFVRSLGAETVVDYQAVKFESVVHDMDVVFDTVGGDVLQRSWQVLRPGGILVTIAGQPSAEAAQTHKVRGATVGPRDPQRTGELLRQITSLIEAGQVVVQVTQIFPLADAGKAHAVSETRHGRGRIVLHIAD